MGPFESLSNLLNRIQLGAIVIGVVGTVIAIIGAALDIDHFFHIYLVAFVFWLELSLGCLAVLMIPNLIDAQWSLSVERVAAAVARTLPLMGVLFIPLLLGLDRLFPGYQDATAGVAAGDLNNFGLYLSPGFFIVRAIIYFAIWIGLSLTLTNLSYQRDTSDDPSLTSRAHLLSVVGGILFFLTATFSAFDWSMAIEEEWFSSIYGWLAISRQGLGAMALFILILGLLWRVAPMERVMNGRVIGDLGTLQFGVLIGWAYLAFIQYIVIWSGNISSKTIWYAHRLEAGWEGLAIFLVLIHALVFVILVIPGLRRLWGILFSVATVLVFMRLVDIFWTIMPTYREDFVLEWWDIGLVMGMGGFWVGLFVWSLKSHSFLPLNRPLLNLSEQEDAGYEPAH